ncbi:glgA [Acrasis kona]|uniref:GlgA n=1 Tax=Acrasis kona TaxID=1008807 RepID=A0AAW2ZHK5_9EUKA
MNTIKIIAAVAQFATDEIIHPLDVRFYFGLPEDLELELYTYFYDHPKNQHEAFSTFIKCSTKVLRSVKSIQQLFFIPSSIEECNIWPV